MKIKSIYISSFGKFNDRHFDFSDGMTVLFGENEAGKTTLMAFIKMMFYGSSSKSSDIEKNLRTKYRPWGSDAMAGSITFTHCETDYRLEREFGKGNSSDKITLIDLDTGELTSFSGNTDMGSRFFGLAEAAFERSVFIQDTAKSDVNGAAASEINAKLYNATTEAVDDASYQTVLNRLCKAEEALFSKSRRVGKCDRAEAELDLLEQRLQKAYNDEEAALSLKLKIENKELELKEQSARASQLFEQLKSADKLKKNALTVKYISAVRLLEEKNAELLKTDGSFADKEFIAVANRLSSEVETDGIKIAELQKRISALTVETEALEKSVIDGNTQFSNLQSNDLLTERENTDNELFRAKSDAAKIQNELDTLTPKKKLNLPLVIAGAALIISAIVCFGFNLYIALGFGIFGIVTAVLGVLFKKSVLPDDSSLKAQLAQANENIDDLLNRKQQLIAENERYNEQKSSLQIKLSSDTALYEIKKSELAAISDECKNTTASFNGKMDALLSHIGLYTDVSDISDAKATIARLKALIGEVDILRQKVEVLGDNAGCHSLKEAEEKATDYEKLKATLNINEAETETLQERFKLQSEIMGKIRSEIAALKAELKAMATAADSAAILEKRKYSLIETVQSYKNYAESVNTAKEALDEAFRELRRSYSGRLNERTAEIFTALTLGNYDNVNISKNLEAGVTSKSSFGLKESAYLSGGTEDQLYFSVRLSVAELISEEGEALPIFADDPFSQYDDLRSEKAVSFLKDYAQKRQIILFTCHGNITDIAEKQSIQIQKL